MDMTNVKIYRDQTDAFFAARECARLLCEALRDTDDPQAQVAEVLAKKALDYLDCVVSVFFPYGLSGKAEVDWCEDTLKWPNSFLNQKFWLDEETKNDFERIMDELQEEADQLEADLLKA